MKRCSRRRFKQARTPTTTIIIIIIMTIHKALHPREDVDRLYVSRKQGGRGLASIEDTVDASIQRLEDYIEKHERERITTI